jgi:tripartite-type tricarboxylate transporter receptor subunit TctC
MNNAIAGSALGFVIAAALATAPASAQQYPSKPIRFVQPSAAGVQLDVGLRAILAKLNERFGWNTVVDNRPGGQFIPSTTAVTQAEPDGYTVLNLVQSVTIVPFARKDAPFDIKRDLAPVVLIGTIPLALVVHPSVPAKSLNELISYSKANPGKLNYAIPGGSGTSTHLTGEYLKLATGLNMAPVSYKDTSTVFADIFENRVAVAISATGNWLPHFKAGKVRGIAVTSAQRDPNTPDLPTMIEATGNKELDLDSWAGWAVPAKTPRAIIDRLYQAYAEVIKMPDLREQLMKVALTPALENPEVFGKRLDDSARRWERTIREAGVKFE